MWAVRVQVADALGQLWCLTALGEYTIGRPAQAKGQRPDIIVEDKSISRVHAVMRLTQGAGDGTPRVLSMQGGVLQQPYCSALPLSVPHVRKGPTGPGTCLELCVTMPLGRWMQAASHAEAKAVTRCAYACMHICCHACRQIAAGMAPLLTGRSLRQRNGGTWRPGMSSRWPLRPGSCGLQQTRPVWRARSHVSSREGMGQCQSRWGSTCWLALGHVPVLYGCTRLARCAGCAACLGKVPDMTSGTPLMALLLLLLPSHLAFAPARGGSAASSPYPWCCALPRTLASQSHRSCSGHQKNVVSGAPLKHVLSFATHWLRSSQCVPDANAAACVSVITASATGTACVRLVVC
jgi:hypothetical protein